jgi:hypothetical protein
MVYGDVGDDLILWQDPHGTGRVDAGLGSRDVVHILTGELDDQMEIFITADYETTVARTNQAPFSVTVVNAEGLRLLTGAGSDTVQAYGLWFPGVAEMLIDLGQGDDTFIGAQPDEPVGSTRIMALGGAGDDTFMGGPGKGLFDPEYEYPTPPPVVYVSPIAHWRFNEEGGHTVADSAGEPQDGTFFGCRPDLDDPGPAAAFDAGTSAHFHHKRSEYVAVAHDAAFEVTEGTVQLWFNTDRTRGDQTLFSKDHSGYVTGGHLNIGLDGSRIAVRLQSADHSYYIKTDKLVKKGTWYHLAFTFGEGGMQLYLNGERVGDNSFTGGLNGNSEPIVIGGSLMWNTKEADDLSRLDIRQPFDGHIDEVAFYGRALDNAQIQQLMSNGPLGVVAVTAPATVARVLPGMKIQPPANWVDSFLNDMDDDEEFGLNGEIKIEIYPKRTKKLD